MTREATDAEMLAAVERWARARGFDLDNTDGGPPWWVGIWGPSVSVQTPKPEQGFWMVDPHTALLWACTVETTETLTSPPMASEAEARAWAAARVMGGRMEILRPSGVSARQPGEPREFVARVTRPLAVDVGKCPACVSRSLPGRKLATTEWGIATAYGRTKPYIAHARYHPADGWLRGWGGKRRKGSSQWAQHHARPCPDCNGTGRKLRDVARLVLDAAPTKLRRPVGLPGDPQARDHIDVVADKLQGPGEPLGLWYALWLAGKRDDTTDAVGHLHAAALRHELISYPGQSDDRTDAWTAAWERATVPCERCEETGRVTTHHTPVPGANGEMSFAALELPGPGPAARSRACPDCGGHGRVRSERG